MFINVTMPDRSSRPIRLSFNDGRIYICFIDIIESSSKKDINILTDDDNEKVIEITGKDNFAMLYFGGMPIPVPFISHEGLNKLIDYSEIEDYLIKKNLSKIDEFITKNKKIIIDTLFREDYKMKIKKNTSNEKAVINDTSYNDNKMKEINFHIKEIKKHLDIVLKLQEELMEGEKGK